MIEKCKVRTRMRRLKKLLLFIATLALASAATVGAVGAEGCIIREIQLEKQENDVDTVVINIRGCTAPKVMGLERKAPRIVLDFPAGRFDGRRTLQMRVDGGSVVRIRGAIHEQPVDMLRIVLDLKPGRSYGAEQTWDQGTGRYIITVTPTPVGPPKIATPGAGNDR
ncbi:MAG: AMIN domain-containing protein [Pseudomonadota bacterium]|nr:AMIN domain-containing protein [Pseudomonadota bacterium]